MIENTCKIGGTAVIGYTPENNARELRFDIGRWKAAWPDATPEMVVVRPGEDVARPVVTRVEGNWIIWTVRRYDTAINGSGRMWVIFSGADGEMLGETPATMIRVMPGPPNIDGEEPPETEIPWVSKTLSAASRAEDAAKRAEDAADRVQAGEGTGGGGSGEPGEDGGYYVPSVSSSGDLSWQASKEGMPEVPGANIKGPKGDAGRGISNIERTDGDGSAGTVDTYTIYYTDGTKSTYQVRNGADGKDGSNAEGGGASVELDNTLTQSGKAADAKATGDALNELKEANAQQDTVIAKKANDADLAAVAKSGNYNDLSNKPTIPAAYTLPIANATTLGGVKPVAATADMTQDVGVTADGRLKTPAASGEQIKAAVNEFLTENPVDAENCEIFTVIADGGESWIGFTYEELGISGPADVKAIMFSGENLIYVNESVTGSQQCFVKIKPEYSVYGIVLQGSYTCDSGPSANRNTFDTSKIEFIAPAVWAAEAEYVPRASFVCFGNNHVTSQMQIHNNRYPPGDPGWYHSTGLWMGHINSESTWAAGAKFTVKIWRR